MNDTDFTQAELVALLTVDSTEARKHARCGPKARCRIDAIAKCDEDLDALLALEVPDLRTMVSGPITGG